VTDASDTIERFRALALKRKSGLLESGEEEEYRRLGRGLAEKKKSADAAAVALRGKPLLGCDFFDDFPELYRRGLISNGQPLPGPKGDPVLPGAVSGRGQVVLLDGQKLTGHVLWVAEPTVDGKPFSRQETHAVMLRSDGGALPGSGRRVVTADRREIVGFLASNIDDYFIDLIPEKGAPKGVARLILRKEQLRSVDPWQPA
jgi:hypothetical protein